jgi:rhamnogalacturonyl hydrolase YesR
MTRREMFASVAAAAGLPQRPLTAESILARMPKGVPAGVAAIMARQLALDPVSFNTDWFGTCRMQGLLEWAPRGFPEIRDFGKAWLDHHLKQKAVAPYSGNRSARVLDAGGIAITTYAGLYGLSFPCYELFRQTGDERARRICLGVADVILHKSARNRFGLVAHDDLVDWAIPDVCYFVVTALMIASKLDKQRGPVYRDQAIYQLRTYTDVFLAKDTSIAKTMLLKDGIGKTYWSRATGWLLWSMTGVLRHLSPEHPAFAVFVADLKRFADGIARHQDTSGGIHLYVDDPKSPLEMSGSAMCAMALHESVRKGWLPNSYAPMTDRFWSFVKKNIGDDGKLHSVYTGWALPAENGQVEMDRAEMGWALGFAMSLANEMTLA